ncbi:MAG: DNA-3-methyladenine glycosylase [Bacteroidota bacterium]
MKLSRDFYTRDDVCQISKDLLGKYLFTRFNAKITAGIITETEAYAGITDRASHAYGNRRTKRTEVMYHEGGVAYVYLCYGMHHLFNIVTNKKDIPHAVLIRGIKPVEGVDTMNKRRTKKTSTYDRIISGPGIVTQALGIKTIHTRIDLCGDIIWLEDRGIKILPGNIIVSPRIGVAYAKEDALLPYRFQFVDILKTG